MPTLKLAYYGFKANSKGQLYSQFNAKYIQTKAKAKLSVWEVT